jgi:hypothetical protein
MLQKRKNCLKRFNPCLICTGSEKIQWNFNRTVARDYSEKIQSYLCVKNWAPLQLCMRRKSTQTGSWRKILSHEKCCLLSLNQLYLSQLWMCLSVSFCAPYVFCLLPAVSSCQPCHTCLWNLSHAVSYACLSVVSCLTCLCELFSVSCSCQLSQQLSYEFTCLLCAQNCLLSNLDGLGLEGGQGYLPVTCLALPKHPQLKARAWCGLTVGSGSQSQLPRGGGWGRHPLG